MVQMDSAASHCQMHKPLGFTVSASANRLRVENNIKSLILIRYGTVIGPSVEIKSSFDGISADLCPNLTTFLRKAPEHSAYLKKLI